MFPINEGVDSLNNENVSQNPHRRENGGSEDSSQNDDTVTSDSPFIQNSVQQLPFLRFTEKGNCQLGGLDHLSVSEKKDTIRLMIGFLQRKLEEIDDITIKHDFPQDQGRKFEFFDDSDEEGEIYERNDRNDHQDSQGFGGFGNPPSNRAGGRIYRRGRGRTSQRNPSYPSVPSKKYYCDICDVYCGHEQTLTAHLEGRKHKRKVGAMEQQKRHNSILERYREPNGSFFCRFCNFRENGIPTFLSHLNGRKHKRCEEKGIRFSTVDEEAFQEHLKGRKHQQELKRIRMMNLKKRENTRRLYNQPFSRFPPRHQYNQLNNPRKIPCGRCVTCNLEFFCEVELKEHMESEVHRIMMNTLEAKRERYPDLEPFRESQGFTYLCKACGVRERDPDIFKSHVESEFHRNKTRDFDGGGEVKIVYDVNSVDEGKKEVEENVKEEGRDEEAKPELLTNFNFDPILE